MVNMLISMKACVNIPTSSEWYPVHAALEDQNEQMLDKFMDSGVDIYGYKSISTSKEVGMFRVSTFSRIERKVKDSSKR